LRPRSLVGRAEIVRLAAMLLLVVAAPTVGDIGGCGEAPADLNAAKFFLAKADVDCSRCDECRIASAACDAACKRAQLATAFPEGCYPIQHDGEVCLNALAAASCEIYTSFMADEGATTPTECNFCPAEAQP